MTEETSFAELLDACEPEHSLQLDLIDGQIAVLILNRPSARNALNAELTVRLAEAVRVVERDPVVNVGILTGAGGAFCAGADLKEVLAGGLDRLFTEDGGLGGFTHAPRAKPWIAAVNGPALAGGFELVLSCDLALASKGAIFGLPEVSRGLMASAGGIYRLPRSLPRALALEMILTGKPIDAVQALAAGLVNGVVETPALDAATAMARAINANAPLAVQASLSVARKAFDDRDGSLYDLGNRLQAQLQKTADYSEGSRAFVEKRAPRWLGR